MRDAVVIQTDVRDSRLRLLADDLHQVRETLEAEVADETALRQRQASVESTIAELQTLQQAADDAGARKVRLAVWSPGDLVRPIGCKSVPWIGSTGAGERVRHLQPEDEELAVSGRDPEQLDAEARSLRTQEFDLGREVQALRDALAVAESSRCAPRRKPWQASSVEFQAVEASRADRREGLATTEGKVNAAVSRRDPHGGDHAVVNQIDEAQAARGDRAAEFARVEVDIVGLGEGEVGLDETHERAQRSLEHADAEVERLRQ